MLLRMKPHVSAIAFAVVAAAATARADDLPRTTKLADGVYAYEHVDPTKRGVTVNNLIVVTSEGVLVADGQGTVDNTKALVAEIATLTPAPIRYVVVGSIHGDHRGGDAGFPASATFIKEKQALTLGGREIQVLMLGRAHTGVDLEVWLPREKILYMSEVFSNRVFPSMANGFPTEWIAALKRAEAMNADVYMPAHGAIDAPKRWANDEARTYRTAIELVVSEGRRLHDAHVPVDQAPARASWGPFATWIRMTENAAGALKRVYAELDGELPGLADATNVIDLWKQGKPAFGVYAPNENPEPRSRPAVYTRDGGEKLAMNPLYDYVFLNLEGAYDGAAIKAIADGLRSPKASTRKALIVRIPPIDNDGAAAAEA